MKRLGSGGGAEGEQGAAPLPLEPTWGQCCSGGPPAAFVAQLCRSAASPPPAVVSGLPRSEVLQCGEAKCPQAPILELPRHGAEDAEVVKTVEDAGNRKLRHVLYKGAKTARGAEVVSVPDEEEFGALGLSGDVARASSARWLSRYSAPAAHQSSGGAIIAKTTQRGPRSAAAAAAGSEPYE